MKMITAESLIVVANIDDQNFVFINFYNANTESEQIKTICELNQLLDECYIDFPEKVVLARYFNLIFYTLLEAVRVIQH